MDVRESSESEKHHHLGVEKTKLKMEQRRDQSIRPLIEYLENSILAASQRKACRVLLESADYFIRDRILCLTCRAKSAQTKVAKKYQLLIPGSMVNEVLQLSNNSVLGDHMEIQNTLDRVKKDVN